MLADISAVDEIYLVCGYTDMRKSIDGLCAIVSDQLHMDPKCSALYLFCGTALSSSTRGWPHPVPISGRGIRQRPGRLPGGSLTGSCQASI